MLGGNAIVELGLCFAVGWLLADVHLCKRALRNHKKWLLRFGREIPPPDGGWSALDD